MACKGFNIQDGYPYKFPRENWDSIRLIVENSPPHFGIMTGEVDTIWQQAQFNPNNQQEIVAQWSCSHYPNMRKGVSIYDIKTGKTRKYTTLIVKEGKTLNLSYEKGNKIVILDSLKNILDSVILLFPNKFDYSKIDTLAMLDKYAKVLNKDNNKVFLVGKVNEIPTIGYYNLETKQNEFALILDTCKAAYKLGLNNIKQISPNFYSDKYLYWLSGRGVFKTNVLNKKTYLIKAGIIPWFSISDNQKYLVIPKTVYTLPNAMQAEGRTKIYLIDLKTYKEKLIF